MNTRHLSAIAVTLAASLSAGCERYIDACTEGETIGPQGQCEPYVPRALGFISPYTFQTNVSPDTPLLLAVDDVSDYELDPDPDRLVAEYLDAYTMVHEDTGEVIPLEWSGEWAAPRAGFEVAVVRASAPLPSGRVDLLDTNLDSVQTFFVGEEHAPFIVKASVSLTGTDGTQFAELIISMSESIELSEESVVFRDINGDEYPAVVRPVDDLAPFLPTYSVSSKGSLAVSPYFEVTFTGVTSPVSGLPMSLTENPIAFANAGDGDRTILSESDDGAVTLQFWPLGLLDFTAIDISTRGTWRQRAVVE